MNIWFTLEAEAVRRTRQAGALFRTGPRKQQKPRKALRIVQSTDAPDLNFNSFNCYFMGLFLLSAMGSDFQDADEEHKEGLQPRADEERC